MTSGIYKLTFNSGKIYIGQSVDIATRWKQHADKFRKGTAAKAMQAEFDTCGYPDATLLMECHKDHLDMMESMYINSALIENKSRVLNTSIPQDYEDYQIAFIKNNEELLKRSTFEIMRSLVTCKDNVRHIQEELDTLHEEGIQIPPDTQELLDNYEYLKEQYSKLLKVNRYLSQEASKSWWQKLLS